MSVALVPDRPLWELWIAERLADGGVGVVGKAHHCLVDRLAAIELMGLLLDPAPEPEYGPRRDGAPPRRRALRAPQIVRRAAGGVRALSHDALPLAPRSPLNGPMSRERHLTWSSRPLKHLKLIERSFGATVNDILLAAAAGALRDLSLDRGERARRLKAMVPVSVCASKERWGNRIAFVFPDLPCDEPDSARRLCEVHGAMCARKRGHAAKAADALWALPAGRPGRYAISGRGC